MAACLVMPLEAKALQGSHDLAGGYSWKATPHTG
jgi:hypothetical protein